MKQASGASTEVSTGDKAAADSSTEVSTEDKAAADLQMEADTAARTAAAQPPKLKARRVVKTGFFTSTPPARREKPTPSTPQLENAEGSSALPKAPEEGAGEPQASVTPATEPATTQSSQLSATEAAEFEARKLEALYLLVCCCLIETNSGFYSLWHCQCDLP